MGDAEILLKKLEIYLKETKDILTYYDGKFFLGDIFFFGDYAFYEEYGADTLAEALKKALDRADVKVHWKIIEALGDDAFNDEYEQEG